MDAKYPLFKKIFTGAPLHKKCAVLFFAFYFVFGFIILGDYGISLDERTMREKSIQNYTYVFGFLMKNSKYETTRAVYNALAPEADWYGDFLLGINVAVEHLTHFTMPPDSVIYMRHVFNFAYFFISALAFYMILRRRFPDTFYPLFGAFLYVACPRIFAQSFYNNKDLLFLSWFTISVYCLLLYMENKRYLLLAAFTSAVSTNTRILGISAVLLTLAFGAAADLQLVSRVHAKRGAAGQIKRARVKTALLNAGGLMGAFYVSYVLITPVLWSSPVFNFFKMFYYFGKYGELWKGRHLYLGEMISSEVPWHYIPVWMGVTIPVLYTAAFFAGTFYLGKNVFTHCKRFIARKGAGQNDKPSGQNSPAFACAFVYDAYFLAMFFCTLLGFIVFRLAMYDDWRHVYSIFCPFMYIAAAGFYFAFGVCFKNKRVKAAGAGVCAALLSAQIFWMVKNHPYQYVYFSEFARGEFAEKNFCLDFHETSFKDLTNYALDSDDRERLGFSNTNMVTKGLYLTAEKRARVYNAEYENADYYFTHTRTTYDLRSVHPEFIETKAITVDGMKISAISRREPINADIDPGAARNIASFKSSSEFPADFMLDGNFETYWEGYGDAADDYMVFEFKKPANYDFAGLRYNRANIACYPRRVLISVSNDGVNFTNVPFTASADVYFYLSPPFEYKFLKIEGRAAAGYPLRVCEIIFGHSAKGAP